VVPPIADHPPGSTRESRAKGARAPRSRRRIRPFLVTRYSIPSASYSASPRLCGLTLHSWRPWRLRLLRPYTPRPMKRPFPGSAVTRPST
jgi:hypothetical protein